MINYAIPGLYTHFDINQKLLKMRQEEPEYFYPNVNIEAVYGTFPWNIFDGGRIFNFNTHVSIEEVNNILFTYHSYGVASRLVYTNCRLTPENYKNKFGNICLSLCNEYDNNQVVIADDDFLNYIHERYENLSFLSSTTKCLNATDLQKELDDPRFIEVCLDYNLNHYWKMLDFLTDEQKQKCEFLSNAICPPGCIVRKHHYELNTGHNLSFGRYYTVPYCELHQNVLSPEHHAYSNTILYEEMRDVYEPKGFCHFKLEGRTFSTITQVLIYSNYFVKPEYKDLFIAYMLEGK